MSKSRRGWRSRGKGLVLGLVFAACGSALAAPHRAPASRQQPTDPDFPYRIQHNSTFYEALRGLGVASQDIFGLTQAARGLRSLDRLNAGIPFQVMRSLPPVTEVTGVRVRFTPTEFLEVLRAPGGAEWQARMIKERVDTRLVTYTGRVSSSLWESATEAHMDPSLIAELTEVFAWQVDFAREVRVDDRWRLTVEQRMLQDGRFVGWGKIVAAEYENAGTVYTAALYRRDGEDVGYFAPGGASLRRMFLRSPIQFGRISSRFVHRRFHPVLKINRPHMGVDYAAPTGTPIRAVGDGVVTEAGWKGDAGRALRLRHNSVYQTAYKHLNGFAPGIHAGTRVRQGQIIAYVGSTGLASGPHLHFEFYENSRFVDPLGKKFPSADPVPSKELADFKGTAEGFLATLPPWFYEGVTLPGPIQVLADLGSRRVREPAVSED